MAKGIEYTGNLELTFRAGTDLHHFTSERFYYISKTDLYHLHWYGDPTGLILSLLIV